MVNIYIPVCGLFLSLLLLIIFFLKRKVRTVETKLFSYLILANFVNSLLTVIIIYFGYKTPNSINLFVLLNRFDFWTYIIWSSSFFLYIFHISFLDKKMYAKYEQIKKIVFIVDAVIYLLTLILPVYIYNDGYMYSYGPAVSLLYGTVGVYVVLIILVTLRNYKSLNNKKYIPLYALILIVLITMVIRQVNPGLLLISSVVAYINLIMFFTIENPDMKLLQEVHRSKEISDNANEEKTLFLYNMTQEIRNTTNEINDNANYILESNSIDENKNAARDIIAITSKFRTMTNDILDVSKMDSANLKVYNSKYNIKTVIKEIVNIYDNLCKKKELTFRTNIDHDIPDVLYGDSINLKEVLNIILTNSYEYTDKGYIELNINTIVKNDICRLMITIEDSGRGIKSEDIDKLKVDDKSLSKARNLVTLMNGTMMISSNYGMGTKVKIILDQKVELNKNSEITKYDIEFKNTKILVVDDSESGIKIIEKLLKGTDIKIDNANNGKACLDMIKTHKYDVILLDEELSEIKGAELLKKIKDIRNFNTKVILLTKDNSYEYNGEHLNLGFTDYILKPVKKEDLLNKINKILNEDN